VSEYSMQKFGGVIPANKKTVNSWRTYLTLSNSQQNCG